MATDMSTGLRAALHALIDRLPDEELIEAQRYLMGLSTTDSLERTLLLAPIEDEDLSAEESAALRAAENRYRRGEGMPRRSQAR